MSRINRNKAILFFLVTNPHSTRRQIAVALDCFPSDITKQILALIKEGSVTITSQNPSQTLILTGKGYERYLQYHNQQLDDCWS